MLDMIKRPVNVGDTVCYVRNNVSGRILASKGIVQEIVNEDTCKILCSRSESIRKVKNVIVVQGD